MYNPTTFSTIDELNKCRKIEDLYHEQWRDIPGLDGYQASNLGRIKKLPEFLFEFRGRDIYSEPKILPLYKSGRGRQYMRIKIGDRSYAVHRLVLMAFRGEDKKHPFGHHINNNPQDNRLKNLQWVTHRANLRFAVEFRAEQALLQKQNKAWPKHYSKADRRRLR